jgi:hypothetical protein
MPEYVTYPVVYFLVCIVGNYVIAYWMHFVRPAFGVPAEEALWEWQPFVIGLTERYVALTLMVWAPRYVAPFIGG